MNATNGKEALTLLSSREDIDMVLTDVLMPEVRICQVDKQSSSTTGGHLFNIEMQVSGLQLMDELRNARWRDIPVVGKHIL